MPSFATTGINTALLATRFANYVASGEPFITAAQQRPLVNLIFQKAIMKGFFDQIGVKDRSLDPRLMAAMEGAGNRFASHPYEVVGDGIEVNYNLGLLAVTSVPIGAGSTTARPLPPRTATGAIKVPYSRYFTQVGEDRFLLDMSVSRSRKNEPGGSALQKGMTSSLLESYFAQIQSNLSSATVVNPADGVIAIRHAVSDGLTTAQRGFGPDESAFRFYGGLDRQDNDNASLRAQIFSYGTALNLSRVRRVANKLSVSGNNFPIFVCGSDAFSALQDEAATAYRQTDTKMFLGVPMEMIALENNKGVIVFDDTMPNDQTVVLSMAYIAASAGQYKVKIDDDIRTVDGLSAIMRGVQQYTLVNFRAFAKIFHAAP
jgi:hypothetical protein